MSNVQCKCEIRPAGRFHSWNDYDDFVRKLKRNLRISLIVTDDFRIMLTGQRGAFEGVVIVLGAVKK